MSVEILSGLMEPAVEGLSKTSVDHPMDSKPGSVGMLPPGLQVIGPRPDLVYSHTLLLELKNHPLALQWPPYLDEAYKNNRGVWDPDRWHLDRKRGETPEMMERLPPRGRGDHRIELERGGMEEEGGPLVLSPQRRSFISGCAALPGEGEVSLRPEVPGKRVGSGRLLAREPEGPVEGRLGFRRGEEARRSGTDELRRGPGGRMEEGGRFGLRGRDDDVGWGGDDRRGRSGISSGRDPWHEDRQRNIDRNDRGHEERRTERDRDNRAGRDRNGRQRRNNQPEWMNECVSKSDVIELRGFDGPGKTRDQVEVTNNGENEASKKLNIGNLLPGLSNAQSQGNSALKMVSILPDIGAGEAASVTEDSGQGRACQPSNGFNPGLPTGGISVEDLEREHRERENNDFTEANNRNHNQPNVKNLNLVSDQEGGQEGDQQPNAPNLEFVGSGQKKDGGLAEGFKPSGDRGDRGAQQEGFNYDQIIESINLNSILGGSQQEVHHQVKSTGGPQGSRFSQFFARPQGGAQLGSSRRSSIHDELGLGSNILKEITGEGQQGGPCIRIPSPNQVQEERYFAPISPAAQTRTMTNSLLDIIKGGGQPPQSAPHQAPHQAPHLHQAPPSRGVMELEEGIRRQLGLGAGVMPPQHPGIFSNYGARTITQYQMGKENPVHEQQPESMSAFKKLVAQMESQPESPRDQTVPFGPGVVRPSPIAATLPQNAPTEQEILEQMLAGGSHGQRAPPKPSHKLPNIPPTFASYLATHPLNTELLARPEAEQLILGLNSGTISVDNILQQLGNQGLQHRQRDLLLSVLKLKIHGPNNRGHPCVTLPLTQVPQLSRLSPQPSDSMMLLPQGNSGPSRVSPLMFPPGAPTGHLSVSPVPQSARVPSPQEMTVLTQQIMQQALIKRKLEEQKENFRRRQGDEPGPPFSQAPLNSSPLSFTPTSVMRKTAADRKDSDPRVQGLVPEVKVTSQKDSNTLATCQDSSRDCPPSPGRAITKNKEEKDSRPASLDLGIGVRRSNQMQACPGPGPTGPGLRFPQSAHVQHSSPLLYLQNNNIPGHINPAMLNQATAMAQQQLAAANLIAHGFDPRFAARLPHQHHSMGSLSPSRTQGPGFISPISSQGQGSVNLARFFSPEVLAQAQSGAAPAMPPLPTQKVLTLEEIEARQAAAVRI